MQKRCKLALKPLWRLFEATLAANAPASDIERVADAALRWLRLRRS